MPFVDVSGLRMHLIDEGDGSPLVFLHGFPLDHSMWDGQRRGFRSSHRVLIPDQRGFGKSTNRNDIVSMDQFADDVAAMLDAVGAEGSVTLCGLSMGGYVALAFARRHAHRLGRLVLCDTRSLPDTPEMAENRRKLADRVLTEGSRIVVDAMLPRLFGPHTNERHPEIVDAVRNVMLATSPRAIAAAQRGMAERPDSTPSLSEIRVPTLVIVGEHDVISPPDEMRAMATAIPNATYVELSEIGHMSPTEDPVRFNAALQDWLAR
ncbi:MAG: hypothetical protein B7Z55_01090 [Planctomycetales bacterium 12-60-4]|nr:MAG: hypothetical protein B7Z55_01090 [Planctomycetales bacterium 12-60-4]